MFATGLAHTGPQGLVLMTKRWVTKGLWWWVRLRGRFSFVFIIEEDNFFLKHHRLTTRTTVSSSSKRVKLDGKHRYRKCQQKLFLKKNLGSASSIVDTLLLSNCVCVCVCVNKPRSSVILWANSKWCDHRIYCLLFLQRYKRVKAKKRRIAKKG